MNNMAYLPKWKLLSLTASGRRKKNISLCMELLQPQCSILTISEYGCSTMNNNNISSKNWEFTFHIFTPLTMHPNGQCPQIINFLLHNGFPNLKIINIKKPFPINIYFINQSQMGKRPLCTHASTNWAGNVCDYSSSDQSSMT